MTRQDMLVRTLRSLTLSMSVPSCLHPPSPLAPATRIKWMVVVGIVLNSVCLHLKVYESLNDQPPAAVNSTVSISTVDMNYGKPTVLAIGIFQLAMCVVQALCFWYAFQTVRTLLTKCEVKQPEVRDVDDTPTATVAPYLSQPSVVLAVAVMMRSTLPS